MAKRRQRLRRGTGPGLLLAAAQGGHGVTSSRRDGPRAGGRGGARRGGAERARSPLHSPFARAPPARPRLKGDALTFAHHRRAYARAEIRERAWAHSGPHVNACTRARAEAQVGANAHRDTAVRGDAPAAMADGRRVPPAPFPAFTPPTPPGRLCGRCSGSRQCQREYAPAAGASRRVPASLFSALLVNPSVNELPSLVLPAARLPGHLPPPGAAAHAGCVPAGL